jgi:hypothetical protein
MRVADTFDLEVPVKPAYSYNCAAPDDARRM